MAFPDSSDVLGLMVIVGIGFIFCLVMAVALSQKFASSKKYGGNKSRAVLMSAGIMIVGYSIGSLVMRDFENLLTTIIFLSVIHAIVWLGRGKAITLPSDAQG